MELKFKYIPIENNWIKIVKSIFIHEIVQRVGVLGAVLKYTTYQTTLECIKLKEENKKLE